ncbi:MAG: hypothetical protein FWH26_00505 [Oscillospiraceae bacterium]|nr:hypothetical protein [Oscillospiraceae bacterium]
MEKASITELFPGASDHALEEKRILRAFEESDKEAAAGKFMDADEVFARIFERIDRFEAELERRENAV